MISYVVRGFLRLRSLRPLSPPAPPRYSTSGELFVVEVVVVEVVK